MEVDVGGVRAAPQKSPLHLRREPLCLELLTQGAEEGHEAGEEALEDGAVCRGPVTLRVVVGEPGRLEFPPAGLSACRLRLGLRLRAWSSSLVVVLPACLQASHH